MNILKKWLILFEKDWREFWASKSWIIVLILPLFITFLYTVIYREADSKVYTIAYPPQIQLPIKSILVDPHLKLIPYHNLSKVKMALTEGRIDGVILNNVPKNNQILLLIDKTKVNELTFITNLINIALVRAYATKETPLIKVQYLNQSLAVRWLSLPIWLIQIILTVCLLQAAAAISDEKDRQTLHSLLVSPMTLTDYLLEKLIWNMLVGITAIMITLLLIGATVNFGIIILYGVLGCLIYSAISILIGLFAPGTIFARTLATLIYIISSIPIMVKGISFSWEGILNLFPSYLILAGLEQALIAHPLNNIIARCGIGLLLESLICVLITYGLLKYKTDF